MARPTPCLGCGTKLESPDGPLTLDLHDPLTCTGGKLGIGLGDGLAVDGGLLVAKNPGIIYSNETVTITVPSWGNADPGLLGGGGGTQFALYKRNIANASPLTMLMRIEIRWNFGMTLGYGTVAGSGLVGGNSWFCGWLVGVATPSGIGAPEPATPSLPSGIGNYTHFEKLEVKDNGNPVTNGTWLSQIATGGSRVHTSYVSLPAGHTLQYAARGILGRLAYSSADRNAFSCNGAAVTIVGHPVAE